MFRCTTKYNKGSTPAQSARSAMHVNWGYAKLSPLVLLYFRHVAMPLAHCVKEGVSRPSTQSYCSSGSSETRTGGPRQRLTAPRTRFAPPARGSHPVLRPEDTNRKILLLVHAPRTRQNRRTYLGTLSNVAHPLFRPNTQANTRVQ